MHISAFVPVVHAVLEDGAVRARGVPMARCMVAALPATVRVPVVLSVWSEAGQDMTPRLYAVARDPDGQRRGVIETAWNWEDTAGEPYKVRVFALQLDMLAPKPGIYQVGLFDHPDGTETDHWFPLPVVLNR